MVIPVAWEIGRHKGLGGDILASPQPLLTCIIYLQLTFIHHQYSTPRLFPSDETPVRINMRDGNPTPMDRYPGGLVTSNAPRIRNVGGLRRLGGRRASRTTTQGAPAIQSDNLQVIATHALATADTTTVTGRPTISTIATFKRVRQFLPSTPAKKGLSNVGDQEEEDDAEKDNVKDNDEGEHQTEEDTSILTSVEPNSTPTRRYPSRKVSLGAQKGTSSPYTQVLFISLTVLLQASQQSINPPTAGSRLPRPHPASLKTTQPPNTKIAWTQATSLQKNQL